MVYVSGVGLVGIGRHYSKSVRDLAAEAAEKALSSAGIDSVDYVIVASSLSYLQEPQLDLASYVASDAGLTTARRMTVEAGESSGLAAIEAAVGLLRSGMAKKILVIGVDKLTEHVSSVTYEDLQLLYDSESEAFYNIGHASIAAILARLYMSRYGVGRDELSLWPAMMHSHGKENPYAMLRFAIDPSRVPKALPLAEPLTLLDAYPLGDGAAAVVLMADDQHGDHMARITATASAPGLPSITLREDPLKLEALEAIARQLAPQPDALDVIELHDPFSVYGLLSLEALGLAPPGRAAEAIAEGKFTVGGEGPLVNPSGGLKARGHPIGATDVYKVAEVALQLAGEFPGVRVEGARRGLVVSFSGPGTQARGLLLESL